VVPEMFYIIHCSI